MVDKHEHSNQLVVNEVVVEAPPEEVWEAVATEAGREAWLCGPEERRPTVRVEHTEPPARISWWWWREGEAPRRVELWISAIPAGTRVIAIESSPGLPLPLPAMRACFAGTAPR